LRSFDIAENNQAVLLIVVMGALSRADKLKHGESGNRLKSTEPTIPDLKEIVDMLTVAFPAPAPFLVFHVATWRTLILDRLAGSWQKLGQLGLEQDSIRLRSGWIKCADNPKSAAWG
jgi:hypothetical protein